MTRFFALLGRLFVIVFGFACAALAASGFLHLLLWGAMGVSGDGISALMSGPALVSIPFVALFVGYFAFVPALPFMGAAEVLARRDWLFHALCGGGVAFLAMGLHFVTGGEDGRSATPFLVALLAGAGLVGGIAYWAVAGRNAGRWLDDGPAQPGSPTS